jgi:hypothetical protein
VIRFLSRRIRCLGFLGHRLAGLLAPLAACGQVPAFQLLPDRVPFPHTLTLPPHLRVADVNHDGHDDLLLGGQGNLPAQLGLGDGRFRFRPASPAAWPAPPYPPSLPPPPWAVPFTVTNPSLAPAINSQTVGDLDGDGAEDRVVAHRRSGAARPPGAPGGVWIWYGDGHGGFPRVLRLPLPDPDRHGFSAVALADLDADGRADVVGLREDGRLMLWRNLAREAGLRVGLIGPPGNPEGWGSEVRLHFGERAGPWRRVGSTDPGVATDSPVVVLGTPRVATALEVRWPDGSVLHSDLPSHAREVTAAGDGVMIR